MKGSFYPHLQERSEQPVTLTDLATMKAEGRKIASMTAYDASFAALEDRAGVDVVLVGDSLGMVIQGADTTVPVTVEDMVYHSRVVAAGLYRPFLITDLPFLSYATKHQALETSRRLMQEGRAQMVKFEGGEIQAETVEHLSMRGVPVCGHIGLQPQLIHKLGGFKVQGRNDGAAKAMINDAKALEQAGADLLIIECVPSALGAEITQAVSIPVIGIGAGPDTDGQILVSYDVIGVSAGRKPRFVRNFLEEGRNVEEAVRAYVEAVRDGSYPSSEHCFA